MISSIQETTGLAARTLHDNEKILGDDSTLYARYACLHQCPHCSYGTNISSHMKRHMLKHTGERPYRCAECDATFARKDHLKNHFAVHSGQRPFECAICRRKFRHKKSLRLHEETHQDKGLLLWTREEL
ncbi:hypothetical protein CDAR_522481 [Caerostris darwini]|uniref:C2H2-type domain-containing protein n=1 Tax=Caerostris darwini TaxID=1538125 RepID=A0AAV4VPL3_9ARAC|nr:hypothetical protein CDAR_522481 [Caerostris darwini]